jgi:hypothetical protein
LSTRSYQEVLYVCFAVTTAFAANNDLGIEQKEVNQQNRIEQGVRSGRSTPKETSKLNSASQN